ncbi:MAG: hypothetical protein NVSMB24_07920 [Mucilaginibacter sp.]
MAKYFPYFIIAALGMIFLIIVYLFAQFFYEKNLNKADTQIISNQGIKIDTIQAGNYKIEIKQDNEVKVKNQNEVLEEKIKSFNDRLGDMYLSMGIIIALILAIVAGVYFKTESEVTKHMNKYYGKYKDDILTMYNEAQTLLAQIRANAELSEQLLSKQHTTQPIQGS